MAATGKCKKSQFERSALSRVLETVFLEAWQKRGDADELTLTYEHVSRACGVTDIRKLSHVMSRVRDRMRKVHGLVIGAVTNVGLKIHSDAGKVSVAEAHVRKGTRSAKRAFEVYCGVDVSKLTPEQCMRADVVAWRASIQLKAGSMKPKGLPSAQEAPKLLDQAKRVLGDGMKLVRKKA